MTDRDRQEEYEEGIKRCQEDIRLRHIWAAQHQSEVKRLQSEIKELTLGIEWRQCRIEECGLKPGEQMTELGPHGYCLKCEKKIEEAANLDLVLICGECFRRPRKSGRSRRQTDEQRTS